MPQYRAAWVLPITQPPIRDGWVLTERGRIVAFGHSRPSDLPPEREIDLGSVALLPSLVNAHTHLELSWMRGRLPATGALPGQQVRPRARAVRAVQRPPGRVGRGDGISARWIRAVEDVAGGPWLVGSVVGSAALRLRRVPGSHGIHRSTCAGGARRRV